MMLQSFIKAAVIPWLLFIAQISSVKATGCILVIGGYGEHPEKTMEYYCPSLLQNNCLLRTGLEVRRREHVSALVEDGRVVTAGGDSLKVLVNHTSESFCPSSGKTQLLGDLPIKNIINVYDCSGTAVLDGTMFVAGGNHESEESFIKFMPKTNTWENITLQRTKKLSFHSMAAAGGFIYAMGGLKSSSATNAVLRFKPGDGQWRYTTPMKTPRIRPAAAALGDVIYVCGGRPDHTYSQSFDDCEKFDTKKQSWSSVAPMNRNRSEFAMVALDGKLYATGGMGPEVPWPMNFFVSVEEFDPEKNEWRLLETNMTMARYGHTAVAVDLKSADFDVCLKPTVEPSKTSRSSMSCFLAIFTLIYAWMLTSW